MTEEARRDCDIDAFLLKWGDGSFGASQDGRAQALEQIQGG